MGAGGHEDVNVAKIVVVTETTKETKYYLQMIVMYGNFNKIQNYSKQS